VRVPSLPSLNNQTNNSDVSVITTQPQPQPQFKTKLPAILSNTPNLGMQLFIVNLHAPKTSLQKATKTHIAARQGMTIHTKPTKQTHPFA